MAKRASRGVPDDASEEFLTFFATHAPFAWRALRRLGVSESDIDDIVQEVFVVVYVGLGNFMRHSTERTWLYGICIRVASSYRRRAYRRREVPTESLPECALAAKQEQHLEQRRQVQLLDEILDTLDDQKRAAYVLYELEQLSMAEVAQAVGCELKTAYSRYYAARDHVRAMIGRNDPGAYS